MLYGKNTLMGALFACANLSPALAATSIVEAYTFDATLTSGSLACGPNLAELESCPEQFGSVSGLDSYDLMLGKSLGSTYEGKLAVEFVDGQVTNAFCELGGADCAFASTFLRPTADDPKRLDFSRAFDVVSFFRLEGDTGKYFFGTDYDFVEDGVRFYRSVEFDLTNVERVEELTAVPLMGSAGFLALALGGFAAFSRRKTRAN